MKERLNRWIDLIQSYDDMVNGVDVGDRDLYNYRTRVAISL